MSYVTDLPASAKLLYKPAAKIMGDQAQIGTSGYGAEMGWVCDYADQDAFLETVIGDYENVGNGVTRLVPLRHPTYPNMLAVSFRAEGFGHDMTVTPNPFGYQYLKSRILVTFHIPPWPVLGESAFQTLRIKHGNQGISIPDSGYQFPSTSKRISGVDAAIIVPTTVYMLTMYACVSSIADLATTLQANPVSSTVIFNKPAGQVRFDGADEDYSQLSNGQTTYTRTMTFTYRAVDWNSLINDSGAWEKPTKISDGSYIYGTSDLTQLLNL